MKLWRTILFFELLADESQCEPPKDVEDWDRAKDLDAIRREFYESIDRMSNEEHKPE